MLIFHAIDTGVPENRYTHKRVFLLLLLHIYIYTSSAAQGGGGSFKNRKPIGEVGCCESRMAGRIH